LYRIYSKAEGTGTVFACFDGHDNEKLELIASQAGIA
jgi:hypothetical protein